MSYRNGKASITGYNHTNEISGYIPVIVSRKRAADEAFKITYDDLKQNGIPINTTAVVNLAGQNVLDFFHRWTPTFKSLVKEYFLATTIIHLLGIKYPYVENIALLGI